MKHKRRLIELLERGPCTTGMVAQELGITSRLASGVLSGYLKGGLLERKRIKGTSRWRLAA